MTFCTPEIRLRDGSKYDGETMLKIEAIEAFSDNYIWLLSKGDRAAVVDPGDPAPVLAALKQRGLTLDSILITHHHFDHTGGIEALSKHADITVYGPQNPAISGISQCLQDGEQISVLGETFCVISVPGHTLDHIAYFSDADQPVLFSGDTLFAGGCGRMFEGQADQMWQSLTALRTLPKTTQVYCAHEYTLGNLAFAKAVEPENTSLATRIKDAEARRAQGLATVPSRLQLEIDTNPFLRIDTSSVRRAAEQQSGAALHDDAAVFAAIRGWKDNF